MATITIKNEVIHDIYSFIKIVKGEELLVPVEFDGCVFENKLDFSNTQFEKCLLFNNCVFNGIITLGSAQLKQDLGFYECIFKKKACFNGIECGGKVVFKKCRFDYESESEFDYALDLQAITVRVSIAFTNCVFNGGGINMKSAKIEMIGCHFFQVKVYSKRGIVDFGAACFGDEFSIIGCELSCLRINFEFISVNPKGNIRIGGQDIVLDVYNKETAFLVLNKYSLDKGLSYSKDDAKNEYSIYYYYHNGEIFYVIKEGASFYNITSSNDISQIEELLLNDDNEFVWFNTIEDNILSEDGVEELSIRKLVPLSEKWSLYDGEDIIGYLFYCNGKYYFKNESSDKYSFMGDIYDGLEPFFINDGNCGSLEQKKCGDYNCYYKRNNDCLYKATQLVTYDKEELITIISLTMPTLIATSKGFDLSYISSGRSFRIFDSLFYTPVLCLESITASDDILISWTYFNINAISFAYMRSDTISVIMNTIFYGPDDSSRFEISKGQWLMAGVSIECIESKTIILANTHVGSFVKVNNIVISFKYSQIKDLIIDNIYCKQLVVDDIPNIMFDLRDAAINCIRNLDLLTQRSINYLITGLKVEDIRMRYSIFDYRENYLPDNQDEIIWLIEDNVFVGNAVPLLRKIGELYELNDKQGQAKKIWKYRNKLSIKQKYSKFWSKIVIWWNNWFTDYGLTTWRLLLWLISLMAIFDIFTGFAFGLSFGSALANGFVEFIPINFNEPVVDAIRDKSIVDRFGYGVAVVVYRLLSYIILSVLIASLTGYFNKKNK